jgi:hypothetical protein
MKIVDDMAHIPYIAHLKRMHDAYKREKRLKRLLVLSNALWIAAAAVFFLMR